MGNSESATTCAVGVGSGAVLGVGCAAFLAIPPLSAACFATVGVTGALAAANAADACEMAANENAGGARRKRRATGYSGRNGLKRPSTSPRFMEFEAYDINRDGYISMADVPSYVPNPALKMVLISMMTMLPVMDTGRDGRLSQAEAIAFRDSSQTDQQQLQWMYRFLDKNQDNRRTADEMVQSLGTCSLNGRNTAAWDSYGLIFFRPKKNSL